MVVCHILPGILAKKTEKSKQAMKSCLLRLTTYSDLCFLLAGKIRQFLASHFPAEKLANGRVATSYKWLSPLRRVSALFEDIVNRHINIGGDTRRTLRFCSLS